MNLSRSEYRRLLHQNSALAKRNKTEAPEGYGEMVEPKTPDHLSWIVHGKPVPKPRMTRQDKWKKRPCVIRYREYCDRIRAACRYSLAKRRPIELSCAFQISGGKDKPESGPHWEQRPDIDNLLKSVSDALLAEDCCIYKIHGEKVWCKPGEERTEIKVRQ